MGAEYINSPENNNEDHPNEKLHLYESNPFANPDTNLERDNLPDEDLYERAIFIQNQLEEKSNESSIIKEQKDTKESTNNQITPVVSEKDENQKMKTKTKNKTINNFRENMTWMIS